MSRSYKKTPYCGDDKGKDKKRIANHCVRAWLKQHPEESLQRNSYKKIYNTWDICDYYWITTWKEYWESEKRTYYYCQFMYPNWKKNQYPNKKESYRKWYKYYKMK